MFHMYVIINNVMFSLFQESLNQDHSDITDDDHFSGNFFSQSPLPIYVFLIIEKSYYHNRVNKTFFKYFNLGNYYGSFFLKYMIQRNLIYNLIRFNLKNCYFLSFYFPQ